MPVYQPNAVVGNSQVLVTLGSHGELMTFFYPHIDFSQNLHEGMPAVYFLSGEGRAGRLVWTFDDGWESGQHYVGRTNIVETRLTHTASGLGLTITDLVHPEECALLRRFVATNASQKPIRAKLFQYLDVQLGEVEHKNAVHFHAERSLGVAYWRNICFAIGGSAFDEYGCGRASAGSQDSAKRQLGQGALNRQSEEIGDVDVAVGWDIFLNAGESTSRDLIVAADSNEIAAVARADGLRDLGWDAVLGWTRARWEEHVQKAVSIDIEDDLAEAYYRSLLAIDLLADPVTGSILAAPEFDPFFERSGGYGYCWPRDAVEVCLAMEAAGFPDYLARFLRWAKRTQRPEGYWEQRYWLSGERGPAWCTSEGSLQIDQTASVLFAMGRHARALEGPQRLAFLEEVWDCARKAAEYLTESISPDTRLHVPAFDLWETFRGSFTYSNAAIAAALSEAAYLARHSGHNSLAERWASAAEAVKNAVMSRLWQGDHFARGVGVDGELDRRADASVVGMVTPFEFLRLDDPRERDMAGRCLESLARELARHADGAETILRFSNDGYAGGGPGALTTLWFARGLLRLALAPGTDSATRAGYRARAVASMRAVLQAGTSTGLLPEMMGSGPGSHWAAPHAWTMAAFIMACLLLDRLGGQARD